jgi:predicted RNA binding protein YcfA (HicA-like mRNA interferase family)
MAKHDKTLQKLSAKPTPADIKWGDLKGLLEHLGYKMLNNTGSRRKFFHKGKDALICCHQPHPSPDVDKGCVDDVVEHLKKHDFI